ncbi:hypothetical protein [Pseudoalteromonas rubra]|uniref:hypothetical protein n=1 Tax=Pseudoalteromonas rubra TaxID=43658 RepID=UPI000F79EB68|nr:hypothetical protein [Pseudoalteromonas rubra]
MKKLTLRALICFTIFAIGFWYIDVKSDQLHTLTVTTDTLAYSDWRCGYRCDVEGKVAYKLAANTTWHVQRIRFGKDYMAIKVVHNNLAGWVIKNDKTKLASNI